MSTQSLVKKWSIRCTETNNKKLFRCVESSLFLLPVTGIAQFKHTLISNLLYLSTVIELHTHDDKVSLGVHTTLTNILRNLFMLTMHFTCVIAKLVCLQISRPCWSVHESLILVIWPLDDSSVQCFTYYILEHVKVKNPYIQPVLITYEWTI